MSTQTLVRTYENTWPATGNLVLDASGPKSFQDGDLTVTPVLSDGQSEFGAEIEGINWAQPVSESAIHQVCFFNSLLHSVYVLTHVRISQLIRLQDRYGVLIFRSTGLDNERHIAFSKQLGSELEVNPFFYGRENDRVGEPFLWDVGK